MRFSSGQMKLSVISGCPYQAGLSIERGSTQYILFQTEINHLIYSTHMIFSESSGSFE